MNSQSAIFASIFTALAMSLTGCLITDPTPGQSISDLAPSESSYRDPDGNIVYRNFTTPRLLDIYPAQGPEPSGIAIVLVHGGGWVRGDRFTSIQSAFHQYLLAAGHVVFSIDYTLARVAGDPSEPADCTLTEAAFPENLHDVKWAIGWANQKANKEAYSYDRVVVVGESAGGHLAALAAVTSDERPADLPTTYNIRPDGAITLVGPTNMMDWGAQIPAELVTGDPDEDGIAYFENFVAYLNSFDSLGDPNPIQCLYGPAYETVFDVPLETREAASAHLHVDLNDPPIYMISGTADAAALTEFNANVLEQAYVDLGSTYNGRAWNDPVEDGFHDASHQGANAAAVAFFLQKVSEGEWD